MEITHQGWLKEAVRSDGIVRKNQQRKVMLDTQESMSNGSLTFQDVGKTLSNPAWLVRNR